MSLVLKHFKTVRTAVFHFKVFNIFFVLLSFVREKLYSHFCCFKKYVAFQPSYQLFVSSGFTFFPD